MTVLTFATVALLTVAVGSSLFRWAMESRLKYWQNKVRKAKLENEYLRNEMNEHG